MWGQATSMLLLQLGAAGDAAEAAANPAMQRIAASLGLLATVTGAVVLIAGISGMALWLEVVFPRVSALACGHYRTQGRRCLWTGFVNIAAGLFLVLLLIGTGVLAVFGIALVVAMGFVAMLGMAAAYRHLGARLLGPLSNVDDRGWRPLLAGGLVAGTAFLVPILGQIMLVGVIIRGFGAAVLGILGARRERKEARATAAMPAEPVS